MILPYLVEKVCITRDESQQLLFNSLNVCLLKFSSLTLFLPGSNLESINVVVLFESVDKILVCDKRKLLSGGAVCF